MSQAVNDTNAHERKWELYNSSAYRVLYHGEDPARFIELLYNFRLLQPDKFDKLEGIALRLMFVEQLQYVSEDRRLHEKLLRAYSYNVDRLCAYLSATCLEIAATREEHRSFPDWLKRSCKATPRPDNIDAAIADLVDATDKVEVEDRLLKWAKRLHDQNYLEEAGLSRAFKRLFDNLPEWLGVWLGNVYIIERHHIFESLMEPTTSTWLHAPLKDRRRTIADYLYRQVRNQFTHTVHYCPTMEEEGTFSAKFGGHRYSFNQFHSNGDWSKNLNFSVGLKEGIRESDVIRLIVVYVVRSWLGIADEEVFLERYWYFARRRKLLYELLNEIHANLDKIQGWATCHLYFGSEEFYKRSRVGKLSSQIAESVLSRIDDLDVRFMGFELRNYLHSIQIINDEIATSEANLQMKEGDKRHLPALEAFVRELIEHPQLRGVISHMRAVESFVCHMVSLPASFGASQRND